MYPILNEEETHVVGTKAVLDQDILPAGENTPSRAWQLVPTSPFWCCFANACPKLTLCSCCTHGALISGLEHCLAQPSLQNAWHMCGKHACTRCSCLLSESAYKHLLCYAVPHKCTFWRAMCSCLNPTLLLTLDDNLLFRCTCIPGACSHSGWSVARHLCSRCEAPGGGTLLLMPLYKGLPVTAPHDSNAHL